PRGRRDRGDRRGGRGALVRARGAAAGPPRPRLPRARARPAGPLLTHPGTRIPRRGGANGPNGGPSGVEHSTEVAVPQDRPGPNPGPGNPGPDFGPLNFGPLDDLFERLIGNLETTLGDTLGGTGPRRPPTGGRTPKLDRFGRDLTAEAARGALDPVIGRDAEIDQVLE